MRGTHKVLQTNEGVNSVRIERKRLSFWLNYKSNNMEYQKYIDLGFKRIDLNCSVEFKQTGYHGFALEKKVSKKQMICVTNGELNKPKLYIKKRNSETYHIVPISTEAVIDLLSNSENVDYMTMAC